MSSASHSFSALQSNSETVDQFPDKGLDHLSITENMDYLQSTVTPFDFYLPVQVILNPNNSLEHITV
jgi:hypothetical protein